MSSTRSSAALCTGFVFSSISIINESSTVDDSHHFLAGGRTMSETIILKQVWLTYTYGVYRVKPRFGERPGNAICCSKCPSYQVVATPVPMKPYQAFVFCEGCGRQLLELEITVTEGGVEVKRGKIYKAVYITEEFCWGYALA